MLRGAVIGGLVVVLVGTSPSAVRAQAADPGRSDTLAAPSYRLDAITVVAYGKSTLIRESAVATSVVTRTMIESLPVRSLHEILAYVPGLIFLERDGSGQLPMAVARGFFGGGETSYVRLSIDGVPVNDMRTGTAEWPQVPLASVERVEVLRGGASAVYGDAAMGAVVNVVTRRSAQASRVHGVAGLGTWGERRVQAAGRSTLGSAALDVNAGWSRLEGYREHSASEDLSLAATIRGPADDRVRPSAHVFARRLIRDEPGPLRAEEAGANPRRMNPLFGTDHRVLDMLDLAVGLVREISPSRSWTWDAALHVVQDADRQTLLLTSDFGDTQVRDESNRNLWTRFRYETALGRASLTAGSEIEVGSFSTEYRPPDDAAAAISSGDGHRFKLGVFAEARHSLTDRWNLFAGARFDVLDAGGAGPRISGARYTQVSPRVGANVAYSQAPQSPGHAYVSVARSFKAPTLDQLYDVRQFPAPGGGVGIANPELRPQASIGVEAGLFQRLPLWPGAFAEFDLAMYRLRVDDEIDFDLSTFRFGNILESRHDGLEISLTARLAGWVSLRHASTLMRVVFRGGSFEGNGLKNIPGRSVATAVVLSPAGSMRFALTHRHTGDLYIDDENTRRLPGYDRFGARADWSFGSGSIFLFVDDLFDDRSNSLGFLSFDPASGRQVAFVYPLGGRALRAGVSLAGS
ncbi:MAG: TonB-dependent receptor [Gemmatimonadota bacterium]